LNAIWIWTEPVARHLAGHVSLRPSAVFATGRAAFDLLRLHREAAALNAAPPHVALLFSQTSVFWQPAYGRCTTAVYDALIRSGYKVTFISERQLLEGTPAPAPIIVVPYATHNLKGVAARLDELASEGIAVVLVGEDSLKQDEYDRQLPASATANGKTVVAWSAPGGKEESEVKAGGVEVAEALEQLPDHGSAFRDRLLAALPAAGTVPPTLFDAASGQRAWDVEYRVVRFEGASLVFLMNHADTEKVVRLDIAGKAKDLIREIPVSTESIPLRSKQSLLLRIDK
jgi:hypothetical protein